jgi:2-methylcitrate dehydratase PrpD
VAAGENTHDSSKPIQSFITEKKYYGNCTVVGNRYLKTHAEYAALLNGAASHSLELDDVHNESSLHPAAVIFPTAFALSEDRKVSGKKLIEAIVAGYEVIVRLGKALNPSHVYKSGFHPTGVCGVFGAVATAAKILELSKAQTMNAFGIAGSQASGIMEFLETGAWTKRLHPGWAAHSGIIAAELAKHQFTGPGSVIDGINGFANSYSFDYNLSELESDYDYEGDNAVLRSSIKPHACCRYKQGPLDIILNIVESNDLHPQDIQKVNVYLLKTALPIISVPEEQKRNPKTLVDAQFSMHFGAAIAVLYRKTLLEEYSQNIVDKPEVKEIMKRVHCYNDPDLDKEFPRKWPARVVIETSEETYSGYIEYPKGDPENPLTWQEMIGKFKYLTMPIYSLNTQETIIEAIRNMEKYECITELTNQF